MTTSNEVWKVLGELERRCDIFGGSAGEAVDTTIRVTLDLVNGMSKEDVIKKYDYNQD